MQFCCRKTQTFVGHFSVRPVRLPENLTLNTVMGSSIHYDVFLCFFVKLVNIFVYCKVQAKLKRFDTVSEHLLIFNQDTS